MHALLRWSRTLRGRLTIMLFELGVLPICVLTGYFVMQAHDELVLEDALQVRTTERLAERIRAYVEMHRLGIESTARQASLRKLELSPESADLEAILVSIHEQFPGFINLYFATDKARTVAFYPATSIDGDSMVGRDFSDRWHFQALRANPKTYISPVMQGVGGTDKLLVTIVAPIFGDEHHFRGFVLGALDLAKIQGFVASEALPSGSYAVVTDNEGHAVASPDWKDKVEPNRILSEPLLMQGMQEAHGVARHVSAVTGAQVQTTFVRLDMPEWFVWISRSDAARTAGVRHTLTAGALGLVLLLLGVFAISTLFARSIASPLEVLAQRMKRFAQGDSPTLPSHTAQSRFHAEELETVTRGFEKMALTVSRASSVLRERNALLEHGVRARTAALVGTFESMEEAVALVAADGEILFQNNKLQRLTGLSREEEPRRWSAVLKRLVATGFAAADLRALEIGNVTDARVRRTVLQAGEKARWWQISSFQVRPEWDDERPDKSATFVRADADRVFLLRDVTERREMEELKNSLISVVAHEMKTPVAALRMEVDTLRRSGASWSPGFVSEMLDDMDEDTRRLEHLVTDWLDLSRIEAGALRLNLTRTSVETLADVARDAAEEVMRHTPEAVIFIPRVDELGSLFDEAAVLDIDRRRMRQVFSNLFGNAVRYCDRRPEIRVDMACDPLGLRIDVSDNGIGINPNEFERVFEKFHQADMSTTRRQGGTGLGLPIVSGIMKAHGGTIRILRSSDQGTVFQLTLPLQTRQRSAGVDHASYHPHRR